MDGERVRYPGADPEGFLSSGRRGCGAVTTGFADKFGFDQELDTFCAPCSGYGVPWMLEGGAAAAAL